MVIKAKFASVCPCCSKKIEVGSKVEWSKGNKAMHAECFNKPVKTDSKIEETANKYTKTWMICYRYAGFATAFYKGDTFEEALEALKKRISPSLEYVSHKLYAEHTAR
jgi:hypothetical protein